MQLEEVQPTHKCPQDNMQLLHKYDVWCDLVVLGILVSPPKMLYDKYIQGYHVMVYRQAM